MRFLVVLALLPACVASTTSGLAGQTKSAKGWFCKGEPVVDCRGGCSAQSTDWRAYCGNKKYLCKFNEERGGARMTSGRDEPVFRSVVCRAEE